MFSNKLLISILVALNLTLVACTPEIGEQPPEPQDLSLESTKCLSGAADDIKTFFTGEVTDDRLAAAWQCFALAVVQFEKYVKGSQADRYTSQEIVAFLEKNFFTAEDLQKRRISPALQYEMMKLKRIFIGGSVEYVTREELRSSREFIHKISSSTRKLNPFMKIIMANWKPNLNNNFQDAQLEDFEKSNIAFQVFAKELAEIIKVNESSYKIDDAVKLLREFEKFFKESWDWIDDVEKAVPGAKKLKVTLAGGDENIITNKEWTPVLTLGARGYFQYLRYHYFIKSTPETGSGIRLVYIARTLEDTFSIFQDLLSGKQNGAVTRVELYEILKAFSQFWPDLKVSEKLVLEFMRIKQVLIGGSIEYWSVADFEAARLKVPDLRKVVERFLPYYNIYVFDWDPEFESDSKSREIFKDSSVRLQEVAYSFGELLTGSYSYSELLELLKEVENLYGTQLNSTRDEEKISETFAKYEPLFLEANRLLFGRDDSVVDHQTWKKILPLVGRFYSIYQFHDYFMKDKNYKQTRTIEDLGIVVDDGLTFAHKLLEIKPEGYFTQKELVQLSQKFSEIGLLPKGIKVETYNSLWTAILQHILMDPDRRIRGEKNDRLKAEQLNILRREFFNWRITQVALNRIFKDSQETSLKPHDLLKSLKEAVRDAENNSELKAGLSEVYAQLDSEVSQTLDSENQLQVSNRHNWLYRSNAIYMANLSRMLSRVLIQAFSNEKELMRVNKCEAQQAFDLLADFFRDLDIFDPAPSFISSRFLEANIFMIHGNGDKYLDRRELGELTTVLMSGLVVNKNLSNSLRAQCANPGNPLKCQIYKDAKNKNKEFVTFSSLSEHNYIAARKYMHQLPEYKAFVDRLASQDKIITMAEDEFREVEKRPGFALWNKVFRATLKATGWLSNDGYGNVKKESVYLADSIYYPFVVHYIELLFARFDSTKDGFLKTQEAIKAFPTFKPLLKDLAQPQINSGLIKESDLLAVFTFILRYQTEPGLSNFIQWLNWKAFPNNWDVNVGRIEIAQILDYIATRTSSAGDSTENQCLKPTNSVDTAFSTMGSGHGAGSSRPKKRSARRPQTPKHNSYGPGELYGP